MSVNIEEVEVVNEKPILLEDLGSRFPNEHSKVKVKYGLFKCFCGNEFEAQTYDIEKGRQKSCGCLKVKHNCWKEPLYKVWNAMVSRCYNPNNKGYTNYGGRGISILDVWKKDYLTFKEWAYNNGYSLELSIDRIDVDGNYEPNNCRWVTREVQARNTRILMSTNSSGFRGVSWHKVGNKWIAKITVNSKKVHLGYFNTAIDGAIAYNNYVIENNLEHPLNIIPEDYLKDIDNDNSIC